MYPSSDECDNPAMADLGDSRAVVGVDDDDQRTYQLLQGAVCLRGLGFKLLSCLVYTIFSNIRRIE